MKKIIILTLLAFVQTISVSAQSDSRSVVISNQKAQRSGDHVTVQFRLDVGKRAVRNGHTLIYQPVLTNNIYSWDLPPVVIQGKRARMAEKRHDWANEHAIVYENPKYARNGTSMFYTASVPWQLWMNGSDLITEILDMGCCEHTVQEPLLIAGNLMPEPTKPAVQTIQTAQVTEKAVAPKTTGDVLAEQVDYVRPSSEMTHKEPGIFLDEDRESSLTVYFRQGSSKLEPRMENNYNVLAGMIESIHKLQNAPDSRINHIIIAGFASPEGAFDLNDRLAWSRAVEVKEYITRYTNVLNDKIQVYNGSEDWQGLRLLVEKSNLHDKSMILHIIDNVPIWDTARGIGRESELQKLDGGRTYQQLYKDFFPQLRNATYIKIYYEND